MRVLDRRQLRLAEQAAFRWRYGLLVDDIEVDGFHCESYGVMITDCVGGQEVRRRHVTVNAREAVALIDALICGRVSPVTLDDVLEDWLGR